MQTVEDFLAQAWHAKDAKGFRSQFAQPHGLLGRLAGFLLAATSTRRSLAVLSLLELQPDDRVLEIGFGPGMDIRRVSAIVDFTAGIDPSDVMLRQARKRNAAAIRAGRVELRQASMDEPLPFADESFTAIFSINSFMLWQRPLEALGELRRVLRPDGTIAVAVQPIVRGGGR